MIISSLKCHGCCLLIYRYICSAGISASSSLRSPCWFQSDEGCRWRGFTGNLPKHDGGYSCGWVFGSSGAGGFHSDRQEDNEETSGGRKGSDHTGHAGKCESRTNFCHFYSSTISDNTNCHTDRCALSLQEHPTKDLPTVITTPWCLCQRKKTCTIQKREHVSKCLIVWLFMWHLNVNKMSLQHACSNLLFHHNLSCHSASDLQWIRERTWSFRWRTVTMVRQFCLNAHLKRRYLSISLVLIQPSAAC